MAKRGSARLGEDLCDVNVLKPVGFRRSPSFALGLQVFADRSLVVMN
jgi:hypothetical protein